MRGRRFVSMLGSAVLVAAGAIAPAVIVAAPAGAAAHVNGDFDGDGKIDLAMGAPGHNRVRVNYTRSHSVEFLHPNADSTISMLFGQALAVGDFNGDGYSDLAVGAPDFLPPGQTGGFGNPETEGAVFEFRGSATGLHARLLRDLTGPYDGDEPYNLGDALATADIDHDGKSDLAVTLYGSDNGNIRIYHGGSTGLRTGSFRGLDDYGASALAFGDLNHDGNADLVAGTPYGLLDDDGDIDVFYGHDPGVLAGTPYIIRSSALPVHGGFAAFGASVATGDVNHDGYGDIVAGATYDTDSAGRNVGSILLFTGGANGVRTARYQRITETRVYDHAHDQDRFGIAVDIAKITSDGYPDVVVGAPNAHAGGHSGAGAIFVLRGTGSGLSLVNVRRITQDTSGVPGPPATNAHFGAALFAAPLAGTSNADVAIGAPRASQGAAHGGMVVRLLGDSAGLTTSGATYWGDGVDEDHLGAAIK